MALLYTNQKNKNYLDNVVRDMILKRNGVIPKFGIVSLVLERTPIVIIRDLAKIIGCHTACTDGVRIMFDEAFLEQMFEEEKAYYNKLKANNIVMINQKTGRPEIDDVFLEKGTEFILMHEVYHIVMRHASRLTLRKFYEMAAKEPTLYSVINVALDLKINSNLRLGFPEQRVLASLMKSCMGFDPASLKKYPLMAEELIVEEAIRKYEQNKQDFRDKFQQNAKNAQNGNPQQCQNGGNQQQNQANTQPSPNGQGQQQQSAQPNPQGQGQQNPSNQQGQNGQQGSQSAPQGQPNPLGQGQPSQAGQGQPSSQMSGQGNSSNQSQSNPNGQGNPLDNTQSTDAQGGQQSNLDPQGQLNGQNSGSQGGQAQSGGLNQSGGGNGSPDATDEEIRKTLEELAEKLNRDAETLNKIFEKNRPDNWDDMTPQEKVLNSEAFKKSYVDEIGKDPDQASRDAKAGVPNAPYIPNLDQMLGTTARLRGNGNGQSPLQNGNPDAIPLDELIRRLREANRDDLIEEMGLPKPEDKDYNERLKNLRDRTENMIKQSISQANSIKERNGGDLPGAHINDEAQAYVDVELKKKLDWKFFLRKKIFGDGPRTTRDHEMPDIMYFNDDLTEELGQPYYEESIISYKNTDAILVLVDTSGSMSFDNALVDSISEVFALQASSNRKYSASKVVLLWADTVIRGEPIVITKENYKSFILDNKVKVNGLGGTDIIGSIHEALNNEKIKKDVLGELKVKDVVVFSDLEFYYDAKGLKIPNGISVSMIAPECVSPKLVDEAQKAMPWANVFHIGHDRTVDLRKATRITEELQEKYFNKKK